jgi:transglutaminase-like putative cysteine protease
MHIRLAYDIQFDLPADVAMVALLHVHPSQTQDLLEPDELQTEPALEVTTYFDTFGNRCARFVAPRGHLRLSSTSLIHVSGDTDPVKWDAREVPVAELPNELLRFLLSSRYCEVDLFTNIAFQLFGHVAPGWGRVQAICDWVHNHITFDYLQARPTKTAMNVYNEPVGVCRDFQHLAITFCRALNIPARYATGYLGDIGIYLPPAPMDFSAWFEVYLGNRWWTLDARHNQPRIGRVLMATGRDAADVALTTAFGAANLKRFFVVSDEVQIGASPAAAGQT